MRVMFLSAALAALAACSTEGRLLTPDPEAEYLLSGEAREEARAVDPVCGTTLDGDKAGWHALHEGHHYLFDSEDCMRQFERNPELYTRTAR